MSVPPEVPNWIDGAWSGARSGDRFEKLSPASGRSLCRVARSRAEDVDDAVAAARRAQPAWSEVPPVRRGLILHALVSELERRQQEMAEMVAAETGKAPKEALGETAGAIQLGLFYASEGQRLYGRTTTSGVPNRQAMTIRQPRGVAALIVAANTPIANVAWKVFPALVCGNAAVLKAAEDTPATAWLFGRIAQEAGLPPGVLNIVQGHGEEAGDLGGFGSGVDATNAHGPHDGGGADSGNEQTLSGGTESDSTSVDDDEKDVSQEAESTEPPVEPPENQVESEFDSSKVNPEDFMCFGTIDPEHPECKECPFTEKCTAKANDKEG